MTMIELKVPDIGDFEDVEVIEVLVKAGDVVEAEQSLITIESDKASMEIPASAGGTIKEMKVKLGDKVNKGSVLATIEANEADKPASAAPSKTAATLPLEGGEAGFRAARRPPLSASPLAGAAVGQGGGEKPAPPMSSPPSRPSPVKGEGENPLKGEGENPLKGEGAKQQGTPAGSWSGKADFECDMLVLGSGPGGYSAAFRAADLGMNTVLVERYAALGGVCLNVGCIPSKALLHVAQVIDEAAHFADIGVAFGKPKVDLDRLRAHKDQIVGRLTGGIAAMAKMRKVRVVTGIGMFIDPHHLEVTLTDGSGKKVVKFANAIIAAGSQAVRLPFLPDDPRIVDSTGALDLAAIPKKMLVVGGGIIGLEMGTVYSTLGARLDVVEMLDGLMLGADRDLVRVWQKMNEKRFDRIMLKTRTVGAEAKKDGIYVSFEGADGETTAQEPQRYDLVLQSVGRSPNGAKIGADKAGVAVDARGFIAVDRQMRTNVPHIFAIGDLVGQPMLAHKAVHEGHVAAEAAAGQKSFFDARVIPSVAYTDPEVAWVGVTEDEAKKAGRKIGVAKFPWTASGRAIANTRDEGLTKLIFDPETHRIVGGAIVGTHAGDLISELALAIEMGADATDIGKTIHPHPTLGESVGMAAELYEGVCTDLPPLKRK